MEDFHAEPQLNKKPTTWINNTVHISSKNKFFDAPNENEKFDGTFREAVWPILIVGQVLAVMPVCGVSNKSISEIRFDWKSKRTLYSSIVGAILVAYVIILTWNTILSDHIAFAIIATHVFYDSSVLEFFCFLALASKWPNMMKCWTDAERELPSFRSIRQKQLYIFKMRFIAFGFLSFALIEHLVGVGSQMSYLAVCERVGHPVLEQVIRDVPYLFTDVNNISFPGIIFTKMISITVTFVWNYVDVILLTIGIGLTNQFKLFNDDLKRNKGDKNIWAYQRMRYTKLRDLIVIVDITITHLILISFLLKLITLQAGLSKFTTSANNLPHHLFLAIASTSHITYVLNGEDTIRMAVVSFSIASINDESKRPAYILRAIPSHLWNTECERFLNEVNNEMIALSGLRFFFITRQMILSVIGTVITYELVLMQFGMNNEAVATCGK